MIMRRLASDDATYRQMLGSQSKAVLLLDQELRVCDCNPQALALFRCARQALLGRSAVDLLPPRQPDGTDSVQALRDAVAAALGGLPQSLLCHVSAADQCGFEALVQIEAVELDGRPHTLAQVRDLTRLRQAEQALEASELRLRQLLDNTPTVVFIRDLDGRYLYVNRRFCDMYGKQASEMVGSLNTDLLPAEVIAMANANTARVLEARAPMEFEEELQVGSKRLTFLASRFPLLDQHGEPYAVCAIATDITERKRTEQALRASEQQYRSIFNASVDGMAVLDEQGGIVDVNPAFLALLGYRREEVLGRKPGELLAVGSRDLCGELTAGIADGGTFQRDCTALKRDGRPVEIELRGARMHYQGRPHILAIVRDLTRRRHAQAERERLETQLRQAQKMEAIGHLTGGIAHDFNNILTSVMGYIALAGDRPASHRDVRLGKYLEQAHLASTRARDLIQQMLTFSRGRRGEPRPLSLAPLVKESLKLLRSTLPATIELRMDLDADLPAVLLDPVQIGQVLLNLCINARDAMPGGGSMRVGLRMAGEVDQACASCRNRVRAQPLVELFVTDTGMGIEAEVLERIFEPFFSTKEVGKGSGMGLATVHGIVHEHGGHILVDSAPASGATFRVLLPLPAGRPDAVALEQPSQAGASAPQSLLNGRVLVVEDEQTVGEFMADLLETWGLSVIVKPNPEEARALFAAAPESFDLVVTDYTMPKGTGLDLARQLQALRPELPVILYTGYSDAVNEQDAQRCGVRALVRKPIEPAILLAVMREHLPAVERPAEA
jgi:PAS domain S-box-containing protein